MVGVPPEADEKQEKQFETWLWGEGIPVGKMSFCEKQKGLRAGNYPCFRLIDLQKGKYQIGYEFTGFFSNVNKLPLFLCPELYGFKREVKEKS
jgi:hypothetical protein